MREKRNKKNSLAIRLLGATCLVLLIGCGIYIASVGFDYIAGLIIFASITGLAGPSVVAGDGIVEIISDIFEIIVEAVVTIVEAIVDVFSSIFG